MGADNKPSETPTVPNPCSVCGFPIFGSTIGTGDGTMKDGGSFAHPECYFEERCGQLEKANARLRGALEFMMERGICTEAVMKKARAALQGGK